MNGIQNPAPPLGRIVHVGDLADHRARMDQPVLGYRLVAQAGRSAAPPPAFLFGPSSAELNRDIYGQIDTPELGVTSLADAAIAPTGIGLCGNMAFSAASLNQPHEHVCTVVARLNEASLPCRFVPGPLVPLFGPAAEDEGILLLDYLPRLWLLEEAGYRLDTLQFLVPDPLGPMLETVVRQLGITDDQLIRYAHWTETIRTGTLLLPSILRRHNRLSPHFGEAARFWTARLRLAAPERDDRIYLAAPDGVPVPRNRERIEAIAEQRGYRVVQIGHLGMAERAALFRGARRIAGPYSTTMLYSVFAPPGAVLCALRGTGRGPATLLAGVCASMGQSAGYVLGFEDDMGLTVDETDFRHALDWMELAP